MALVTFRATSASLHTGVGEVESRDLRLAYAIELDVDEDLSLSTGEEFSKLQKHVTVIGSESYTPQHKDSVGRIGYFEGHSDPFNPIGPCCIVEVMVGQAQLAELLAFARSGFMPSRITVDIPGLKFGNAPDGGDKVWNNKHEATLPVQSVSFSVSVGTVGVPIADGPVSPALGATQLSRSETLIQAISQLQATARRGFQFVFWAIVLLALIIFLKGQ